MELLLTGRTLDAAEAQALGLVHRLAPPDEDVVTAAYAWAGELLCLPRRALVALKTVSYTHLDVYKRQELTHAVTQFTANLVYQGQSGALNESMSDVFGSLVKQRNLGQTAAEADWIIGEGLFTSRVNGNGIRNMKQPGTAYNDPVLGKDPQPGHMRDYVQTQSCLLYTSRCV